MHLPISQATNYEKKEESHCVKTNNTYCLSVEISISVTK